MPENQKLLTFLREGIYRKAIKRGNDLITMGIMNEKMYFEEVLINYETMLHRQKKELNSMPEGELGMRVGRSKNSSIQYRHYKDGKSFGITKNHELVKKLARKKFLETSIKNIENNYIHLKAFIDKYEEVDEVHIIDSFPPHYSKLMNSNEAEWNEKKRSWLDEKYERSTYNPYGKTHVTASGLHVRSKSELIIAEKLDYYKIPYRYEAMIYIKNHPFAPDFTILTKQGIKYWEHCGLVNDLEYMRRHKWKMVMYESVGIVPWENLIVTYDDSDGNINTRIINAEIENKLL